MGKETAPLIIMPSIPGKPHYTKDPQESINFHKFFQNDST